jgi:peptidoglycan/LPS O-acetylase OafA/YrhL
MPGASRLRPVGIRVLPAVPVLIRDWQRTWHVKLVLAALMMVGMVALSVLLALPTAAWDRPGASTDGMVVINPLSNLFSFVLGMTTCLAWQRWAPRLSSSPWAGTLLEAVTLALAILTVWVDVPVATAVSAIAPWIGAAGTERLLLGGLLWVTFPLLIAVMASERGYLSRLLGLPVLVLLGEISYALYLLHQIVLRWTDYRSDLLVWMPSPLQIALFCGVTLAGSWLLWRYVERPSRRALLRWLTPADTRRWRLTAIAAPAALASALVLLIWTLWPSAPVATAASVADGAFIVRSGSPQLYIVESGRKRAFQTWESYLERGGKPDGGNVMALTDQQFNTIPFGEPIPRD